MQKRYETISLYTYPQMFQGYYQNYEIPLPVLMTLARDLKFKYDIYESLRIVNQKLADELVATMCERTKHKDITLLLDDDTHTVLGYTLDISRVPVLNKDFLHRVKSQVEAASEFVEISEIFHLEEESVSRILLKCKTPVVVEEKTLSTVNPIPYTIGILLVNDELDTTSSRLVVFRESQPLYLPASFYNPTALRFKKTTQTSQEALDVLILKAIEDLRDAKLHDRVYQFHYRFRRNVTLPTSFEEYNTVLTTMLRVPTVTSDRSLIDKISDMYSEYEDKYSAIEDRRGSRLWRCTALGDLSIGGLIDLTISVMEGIGAEPSEYFYIRELLGVYASTERVIEDIAKES